MTFHWLKSLRNSLNPIRSKPRVRRARRSHATVAAERLEARRLLTTFTVDSILDVNDGNHSAGNLSLREAVELANTTAGADTIVFDANLAGSTLSLTQGQLQITESVTIDGDINNDGTADIVINANQQSRIFNVDDGNRTPNQTIQFDGLTLTGGRATDDGGAILNRENLTLTNSVVSNNSTTGRNNDGGAISNGNGTLTLNSTTISNNSTTGDNSEGGGIYNVTGTVTLNDSTLSNNSTTVANSEGGGIFTVNGNVIINRSTISGNSTVGNNGEGGGIFNQNSGLTIRNSTISGNTTSGVGSEGGGIYTDTELQTVVALISNSTISGNNTSADGGGVYNFDGLLQIRNSTITNNTATGLAGGVASFGDANTTTQVVSSIIAGNTNSDVDLVEGTVNSFASLGNNLIGSGSSAAVFNQTGDTNGVADAGLLPLANNGGPTMTHALRVDSAAVNAGSNPDNLTTDQREVDRAVGTIDIGSYERAATIVVDTLEDTIDNDFTAGDRSLREALLYVAEGGTITFAGALSGQTITLTSGELAIAKSVTIDGDLNNDGTADVTINANQQSRVFNINDNTGTQQTVVLEGLGITGGRVADDGGAIFNRENLTLQNSRVSNSSTTGINSDGGAIFNNRGTLAIESSTISGNSTAGAGSDGGGVYSQNGNVTVNLSTISGNSTAGLNSEGGGIFNSGGSLTLTSSSIRDNSTSGNNSEGGGIYTQEAVLAIRDSTISGNSTTGTGSEGGGIYSDTDTTNPTGVISNSTISGNNSSAADGGGVYNFDGLLQIRNSTITNNTTTGLGAGVASFGDGVTITQVVSSIIAGNNGTDVDFVLLTTNSFVSQGNNLIGTGNALLAFGAQPTPIAFDSTNAAIVSTGNNTITLSTLVADNGQRVTYSPNGGTEIGGLPAGDYFIAERNGATFRLSRTADGSDLVEFTSLGTGEHQLTLPPLVTNDIAGVTNPGLDALADNGGPTQTHALLATSQAIGNGSNPDGLTNDQRGIGFLRSNGGTTDIGAVIHAPTPGISVNNRVLQIIGTNNADWISITPVTATNEYHISTSLAPFQTIAIDAIDRILVIANGGNDAVWVGTNTQVPSTIFGGDGNDSLAGGAADDTIYGGAGWDWLHGNAGNDLLDGGEGSDQLLGYDGNDTLRGGADNDGLNGGNGNDLLEGGDGSDYLFGVEGDDTLRGGNGVDHLAGGNGDDVLEGGADTDYLYGENGNDILRGGDGVDFLYGGWGDDTLEGGAGDDFLFGESGNDILRGGEGADILYGGWGDDTLEGGNGNDLIYGEFGNDTLRGGDGDDTLDGGADFDTLFGDAGLDTLLNGELVTQ